MQQLFSLSYRISSFNENIANLHAPIGGFNKNLGNGAALGQMQCFTQSGTGWSGNMLLLEVKS